MSEKEEKFGKILVDGKMIDLDKAPLEDIDKVIEKLSKQEQDLMDQIEKDLAKL